METLFVRGWNLATALAAAVSSLGAGGEGAPRTLESAQLEVAVLERTVPDRTFRRLERETLDELLALPAVPDSAGGAAMLVEVAPETPQAEECESGSPVDDVE